MVTSKNKYIAVLLIAIANIAITYAQTTAFNIKNLEYFIQNKLIGLRDQSTKRLVVSCKYDYIGAYSSTHKLAPVKRSGLWGYINDKAVETITPKYEDAKGFSTKQGLAPVKLNGKWGFINKAGVLKLACKYENVGGFNDEGLSKVKLDGKWGVINTLGKIVIPCKYDELGNLEKDNTISASLNGNYGLVNKSGQVLVNFLYQNNLYFNKDGYARCMREGKYGIVNSVGKEVIPCIYDQISNPSEGLICVKSKEKYGYVDYSGKVIIPIVYDDAEDFENGIAAVEDDEGCYILSSDTRRLASFDGKYNSIIRLNYCDKDLFVVQFLKDEWVYGLANKDGVYVIPQNKYSEIKIFAGDGAELVGVQKNGMWGFSDFKGNIIIPCQYEDTETHFQNGHIAVKKGEKWGIVDMVGSIIIPFEYDIIDQNGLFSRVKKGEKWGAVGADGKLKLEPKYDEISYPNTTLRYYPVKLNGKDGYADYYGNDTF